MNPDHTLPLVPGLAVTREIARGGMATVYAARDPVFERDVAVKVMHPGCDATQFVVEAKVTAQLPHPGVPPVYALGVLPDRRPFLVMKLIQGQTLSAAIADLHNDRTARFDTLGVFELICQTVGFAHAKGVVHRDLKPSNVMVGKFGEVQVMDWGIAKHVAGPAPGPVATSQLRAPAGALATVAGTVKGTPAYMAPEQARGEPTDARADVFALGGILAALLTGRPPFSGVTAMDTLFHAAAADLGDCLDRLADSGADDDLTAIARRCLEPHPADRYADGTQVAEAIADYRFGVEERLRAAERERAARAVQMREGRKRRRVQAALVGAILLLAVGGGAFAWWNERQASRQRAAQQEQQLKDERAAAEVRERQQRNTSAVALLLDQCEQHLKSDEADRAAAVLADVDRRLREGVENSFRGRVDRCRTDLALLRELDRLDDVKWLVARNDTRTEERAAREWRDGLSKFNLNPAGGAERVHRTLRESHLRERILGTLESWLAWDDQTRELHDFLCAADPDPYRNAVREAYGRGDRAELARLAERPAALEQPQRFALVMANMVAVPSERREQILHAANRARPDSFRVMRVLSGIYPSGKQYAAVRVRWSQAALAVRPTNLAVWTNLGVALQDLDDVTGAKETYRAALKLHPDNAALHNNLGTVLKEQKDLDGAVAEYRHAIRLDPEYGTAHFSMMFAQRERGRMTEAIEAGETAVRLTPNHPVYRFGLGLTYAMAGDYDAAIRSYKIGLKLNPKSAPGYVGLGAAYMDKGDRPSAIEAFAKAVELDPTNDRYKGLLKDATEGKKP